MPPHCDTRDGPVVNAAKRALETGNVNFVLIWVQEESARELSGIFEKALRARKTGKAARDVTDDWFFENAIRLHRAGEGTPYTGMKPAGLGEGPVVPKAEKAIESGNPQETIDLILGTVEEELSGRFRTVMDRKQYDADDVAAGREYVRAFIGWVVYSHHLYEYVKGGEPHGGFHEKGCGCGHQ